MMKWIFAALVIAGASFVLPRATVANGDAVENVAEGPSFKRDITPILTRRCATCHLTGEEPGSMALHPRGAYASIVGIPSEQSELDRVEPGDPQNSYLYHKLMDSHLDVDGVGDAMPLEGWPLPDHQIELIRRWIEHGARNN